MKAIFHKDYIEIKNYDFRHSSVKKTPKITIDIIDEADDLDMPPQIVIT